MFVGGKFVLVTGASTCYISPKICLELIKLLDTSLYNNRYHECRLAHGPFQMKAIEASVARKAVAATGLRPGRTLDSLFANMKAQRMRMTSRGRRIQMQQAQPSRVTGRAIVGQRKERAMNSAENAPFTNRTA